MYRSSQERKLTSSEIYDIYELIKPAVQERLDSFKRLWDSNCMDIFQELVFCLLTPGSRAKVAWVVCERLVENGLLFSGDEKKLSEVIRFVRFKNNKARNILLARKRFFYSGDCTLKDELGRIESNYDKRLWLVKEIRGFGFKEASHFLRNIGFFEDIAILDRHILRSMVDIGLIYEFPKSLSRSVYLRLEKLLMDYSIKIKIPLSALDFILWYRKTGEIFK